jgi:hypothetical protein
MVSKAGVLAFPLGVATAATLVLYLFPSPVPAQYGQPQYGRSQYGQPPSSNAYASCVNAASRQSGYQGSSSYQGGGAVEGAARGALWGSMVGGWSGNAGEGAGWGAAAGAVVGASRRRREKKAQEEQKSAFDQSFQQCMQYSNRAPATPVPTYPAQQPQRQAVTPAPQQPPPVTPAPANPAQTPQQGQPGASAYPSLPPIATPSP